MIWVPGAIMLVVAGYLVNQNPAYSLVAGALGFLALVVGITKDGTPKDRYDEKIRTFIETIDILEREIEAKNRLLNEKDKIISDLEAVCDRYKAELRELRERLTGRSPEDEVEELVRAFEVAREVSRSGS
jgi:predicted  nucleic acid-binding Zn-ribbon protein